MLPAPIRRFRAPLACAIVALAVLRGPALRGQSADEATVSGLEVRSAAYNPAANAVVVELANDTANAVTAYGLDIAVTMGGKTIAHTGYGADLLNLILNARGKKGAADSWEGAIRPGDVHTDTIPANVPTETEITGPVEVHVTVVAAFWSDGAIEGTNKFMIRQMQDGRQATLKAEERVLTILDAHGGETGVEGRIGAVLNDLTVLMKQPLESAAEHAAESLVTSPEPGAENFAREMLNTQVLSDAVSNLTKIREAKDAPAQFQAFVADFTAQHQRRVALLQSMSQA
jgi:hypothetical protein